MRRSELAILRHPRIAGAAVAAAMAIFGCTPPAWAQQPVPLKYTDTSVEPTNDEDRHWAKYFSTDHEVVLQLPSFVAHYAIKRPNSVQGLGVLYVPRLCKEIIAGEPGVSQCPAVLTRYRDGRDPERVQLESSVCLVHFGDKPPQEAETFTSGALVTPRHEADESLLVLSAVIEGQPVPQCTLKVPLGEP